MSRRVPVAQERRWRASILQIVVLVAVLFAGWRIAGGEPMGLVAGAIAYLLYSRGSRALLASAHRQGIRLVKAREWEAAIPEFEASYSHFSARPWLDRWRAILMLSDSAASYREMALVNLAFCLSQLDRGPEAKVAYERALQEFPDSPIAQAALNMIHSVEAPPTGSAA